MTQLANDPTRNATRGASRTTGTRPSALRIGLSRGVLELKSLWREKPQLVISIGMPFLLLVILNEVFDDNADGRQSLATALCAVAIMATALQGVALQVAQERREGGLVRLRGLPMPAASYFIGKVVMVVVTTLVQITLLLGLGHALYHVTLPTDASHWLTFAWVYALGTVCCTLLGLVISNLITGENGGGAVIMPFVGLQLISGVFITFSSLSPTIQRIASIFPLKWMCQGMRSAFLPDSFAHVEVTHTWEHARIALVLGGWTLAALVLCLTTFRWRKASDG
jgi:ABC-2 type transport system permease protein